MTLLLEVRGEGPAVRLMGMQNLCLKSISKYTGLALATLDMYSVCDGVGGTHCIFHNT